MPIELQIIHAKEFVRMGAQGELDLEGSRKSLEDLAHACRKRSINRALVDARDMRTELTPDELAELVNAFDDIGFTKNQRLAVLHKGDQEFRARVFALIGRLRGWSVRALDSYEEAITWLSDE